MDEYRIGEMIEINPSYNSLSRKYKVQTPDKNDRGKEYSNRKVKINVYRYSASHFSPFFAYLSRSAERSRMMKVRTTLAKNSDERLSFNSRFNLKSVANALYAGAIGWELSARVCSSRSCASWNSLMRPWT